ARMNAIARHRALLFGFPILVASEFIPEAHPAGSYLPFGWAQAPGFRSWRLHAAEDRVSDQPERVFRVPPEGAVHTDQDSVLKTLFGMNDHGFSGRTAGLPVRPETGNEKFPGGYGCRNHRCGGQAGEPVRPQHVSEVILAKSRGYFVRRSVDQFDN